MSTYMLFFVLFYFEALHSVLNGQEQHIFTFKRKTSSHHRNYDSCLSRMNEEAERCCYRAKKSAEGGGGGWVNKMSDFQTRDHCLLHIYYNQYYPLSTR